MPDVGSDLTIGEGEAIIEHIHIYIQHRGDGEKQVVRLYPSLLYS